MEDGRGYHLDVEGLNDLPDPVREPGDLRNRPWVGVRFGCCRVYVRVYRNAEGTAYEGRCPRCLARVRLIVGPDGTDARFFIAE